MQICMYNVIVYTMHNVLGVCEVTYVTVLCTYIAHDTEYWLMGEVLYAFRELSIKY